MEGLEGSGRLRGMISAYPDTSPTTWCRVMAENTPGGPLFVRVRHMVADPFGASHRTRPTTPPEKYLFGQKFEYSDHIWYELTG